MKWLIEFLERNQIPCQWKSLTGLECFGCGMQRGIVALLKGDLIGSLQAFPALIPLIISIALGVILIVSKSEKLVIYFKISIIFTASLMFLNFFYKLIFL